MEFPARIFPQKGFDYINTGDPPVTVNPTRIGMSWLNLTSGEIFVCIDNTTDTNEWVGQKGSNSLYSKVDILGDSSCISLYLLEADATDESGTNDGTAYNTPTYDGTSVYLNGTNQYITFPIDTYLPTSAEYFSFSMWSDDNQRLQYRTNGNGNNIEIYPSNIDVYSNSTNYDVYDMPDTTPWRHIVLSVVSDTEVDVFVDGVYVANNASIATLNNEFDNEFRVGVRELDAGTLSGYTAGYISQIRVFNKALDEDDARYIFNIERGKFGV